MKYFDDGKLIYITDYGTNGKVWSAIYAETGEPVVGIGTHVSKVMVEDRLSKVAKEKGWRSDK